MLKSKLVKVMRFRKCCIGAVENDAVAESGRGLGRENFAKLPLDLFRLLQVVHQTEAVGDTDAVGIHNGTAGDMKHIAKDQVGGLAADAGKGGELLHGGRDLTVMLFQQNFGARHNIPGFGMIEAAGVDILLHLGDVGGSKVFQGGIAGKEGRGDLIDALIRTLGGKANREEKLVGFGIIEGTVGLRVFRKEETDDFIDLRLGSHSLPPV
jgi:hypothetical protein